MNTNTTRRCPTCGQEIPQHDTSEIGEHVKYKQFKDYDYNNRVLNSLKLQLDVMFEHDRNFIMDVMFRVMQTGESPFVFPLEDQKEINQLHWKYCK